MSEPDRSGAHILALAAEHDVITADELPDVLASIEEARSGPAGEPWPADEVERLRDGVQAAHAAHYEDVQKLNAFAAELDRIGTAVEAHLPPLEGNEFNVARIANAGAVIDATARDRDEWRRKHEALEARVEALETTLSINRTDPDEPLNERMLRVYLHVIDQRANARKMERSRDHWKAKAQRLSEGARRGVVGSGGAEARRAARKGDAAGAGHRTGKRRAKGARKGRR
jgi:hypothetical protein